VTHRVVLDTNVVFSALAFDKGYLAWIRRAWERQQIVPLACKETVDELIRILAYPKFKLTTKEKEELLGDFLLYADTVELPKIWPELPVCRDKKDQVFIVLAHIGNANALISGDSDILVMREHFPDLILNPKEFSQWFEARA